MPYKKTGVKKLSRDAEKTQIFVHRGLRYANKQFKFASSTKFDLRLKKKTKKLLGQFQFYLEIFFSNCMKIV